MPLHRTSLQCPSGLQDPPEARCPLDTYDPRRREATPPPPEDRACSPASPARQKTGPSQRPPRSARPGVPLVDLPRLIHIRLPQMLEPRSGSSSMTAPLIAQAMINHARTRKAPPLLRMLISSKPTLHCVDDHGRCLRGSGPVKRSPAKHAAIDLGMSSMVAGVVAARSESSVPPKQGTCCRPRPVGSTTAESAPPVSPSQRIERLFRRLKGFRRIFFPLCTPQARRDLLHRPSSTIVLSLERRGS